VSNPSFIRAPLIYRWLNGSYLTTSFPKEEKQIWLTFDDGPESEITPQVLDILKERSVGATFFCVGANAAAHPGLMERIVADGHLPGNHTWHHLHGWKTPPAAYAEDVTRCDSLFYTGIFRPPHGKFTPSQYYLLRERYRFILWSVLTYDFSRRITPEKCLDIALTYTTSGSVVVFHDSLKAAGNMLYALPRFLDHFLEQGYSFRNNW